MSDLMKCFKHEKTGNIITAKGRLSYAFVWEATAPKQNPNGAKTFSTALVLPPEADLTALKEACKAAALSKFTNEQVKQWTEAGKFRMPYFKAKTSVGDKGKNYPDELDEWTVIRTTRYEDQGRPDIIDAAGQRVTEQKDVYAGRWARISVLAKAYDNSGNRGVRLNLVNIQLLENGEQLGGGANVKAESEFAPVPGVAGAADPFGDDGAPAAGGSDPFE